MDTQLGLSSGRDQNHKALRNIQGLVSCVGMPAPGNCLDVLCLAEWSLHDHVTLMDLRLMLTNERAEVFSIMAEVRRLE